MTRLQTYVRFGRDALGPGALTPALRAVGRRLHSTDRACGLQRDLEVPHVAPTAAIPISVRPLVSSDVHAVLENGRDLSPEENWDRRYRRLLLEEGIGKPFVAATEDDEPCYVQWLFSSEENSEIHRFFRGIFPVLDSSTALLEGAFTPTVHRGKKIMSAAMALIAERAAVEARYVVTFVGVDNPASLKGCARAGFTPYTERTQRRRFGRDRVGFTPVAETPHPSREAVGGLGQ